MQALAVSDGIGVLHPNTDPHSVRAALAAHRPSLLQFSEPLPDNLLDAAAEALHGFPEIDFRVYGRIVDPSLESLSRFRHHGSVSIDLWHATSFDLLASFDRLQHLSLGETASKRVSLAFLRQLPDLEVLRVEAHDRDFEAVGEVLGLRELYLRVPRTKSLEPLRGHTKLRVIEIDFGGIRDLGPLSDVPGMRGVGLYQVRGLDTDDLQALGDCTGLVAVSLGALRNITRLTALTRGPSASLRYLTLERLTGLETLDDLAECDALEQVYLVESKPHDRRLDLLAAAPRLRHLVVGDHYPKAQVEATVAAFRGETLWIRGRALRGDPDRTNVDVAWRRSVASYPAVTQS